MEYYEYYSYLNASQYSVPLWGFTFLYPIKYGFSLDCFVVHQNQFSYIAGNTNAGGNLQQIIITEIPAFYGVGRNGIRELRHILRSDL